MAVPEVIEWENIGGFKYCGRELVNDIDIEKVIGSLNDGLTSIENLKSKNIQAIRNDNGEVYKTWNAYRCLYAEITYKDSEYCLNNGHWYCVNKNFVTEINQEYNAIPVSDMMFIPCNGKNRESDYTKELVDSNKQQYLLMDAKSISHGGGHSKIELCDILTSDGKYIHIKKNSSSAMLSHLFNQALVSAQLVIEDNSFVEKANIKINEETDNKDFLINNNDKPTVIMAIISQTDEERPRIPFFSKMALKHVYHRLKTSDCKVYIKNIQEIQCEDDK